MTPLEGRKEQRSEGQPLENDQTEGLKSLEEANARIRELEEQVSQLQTLYNNGMAMVLKSLEEANARIKELEEERSQKQTLHNDLAKAQEGLEQANARIKQLEGQAAKDSHNKSPATIERWLEASRYTKRKACGKRAAKKVEGNPAIKGKP
jgi:hypothetical protein